MNLLKNKNLILLILIFFLSSCWSNKIINKESKNIEINYNTYIVWWLSTKSRVLEWNIIANNLIKKSSWISGIITKLNCKPWEKVNKNTLIAIISPDLSNPNIKSIINNRDSLSLQLENLKWIKISNINNLDTQISTLESSILSTKNWLELAQKNYDLTQKQKLITSSDLDSQIKNLEVQLINLNNQKELLEKTKNEELEKLESSLNNFKNNSYNTIWEIMNYIDEIYWITNENKNKNDSYEIYLSAKDSSIKNKLENDFLKLNYIKYKDLLWEELSDYISEINELIKLSYNWVKKSVTTINFTDIMIDTYYNKLLWYSNWLLNIKSNLDSIINNETTIKYTYDNQIAWLSTNIDTLEWNIDNLKNNKTESALIWIDSNITNLESQINSLKDNINTLSNNLETIKENKEITIKQFDNQILNLQQNINNLNINLSPQNIYSEVNWIINNNYSSINSEITTWAPICEILVEWKWSLKLRIASANKLIDWFIYIVKKDEQELFTGSILSSLPTKDNITQNYIYEKILEKNYNLIVWDKVKVEINYKDNKIEKPLDSWIIEIPLEYVTPKLDWYFVKTKDYNWNITNKKIQIWEINLPNIQIIEWLEYWEEIIK